MLSRIFTWLAAYFGASIARVLTGAGLGIATFAGLSAVVLTALNLIVSYFAGLPVALAQVVLLGGFATVLNMLGGAILTRLALTSGALSIRKVA